MDDEKYDQTEGSAQAARTSAGRHRHQQVAARAGVLAARQQKND